MGFSQLFSSGLGFEIVQRAFWIRRQVVPPLHSVCPCLLLSPSQSFHPPHEIPSVLPLKSNSKTSGELLICS